MLATRFAVVLSAVLAFSLPALADVVTLVPDDPDIQDLPHAYYYTWGETLEGDFSQAVVTSSTLTFHSIRNNDWSSNHLYVHLLNSAPEGLTRYTDNQGGGDSFAGQGIELVTYTDLPPIPQDLVYTFDPDELSVLTDYLHDENNVALGIDPDCHFYNCGVTWSLTYDYTPIPEPGVMVVLGAGGVFVAIRRRRR
jgi:hypothetical protein